MDFRRITICGGGNAAHFLMALLGQRNADVTVYAPLADEAEQLRAAMESGGVVAVQDDRRWQSGPLRVTRDPTLAFSNTELVLLALPASAHEAILAAAGPYLPPGTWVVAMPARGGFDWAARQHIPQARIAGLQTLPWACRIEDYGHRVRLLGAKRVVDVATDSPDKTGQLARTLSALFQVRMEPAGSFLGLTLANVGQLIHPGIMYGLFRSWTGDPYTADTVPRFYAGVTPEIATILQDMSDEVQEVAGHLAEVYGTTALQGVRSLHEWLLRAYNGDIMDGSTLRSCFTTNRAYSSLKAPMRLRDGGFAPDFGYRYLAEDIPYGLLVTRGIAETCGVATPRMDAIIEWAQDKLGRRWLEDGRVAGADLVYSRAPQRYGFNNVDDL